MHRLVTSAPPWTGSRIHSAPAAFSDWHQLALPVLTQISPSLANTPGGNKVARNRNGCCQHLMSSAAGVPDRPYQGWK